MLQLQWNPADVVNVDMAGLDELVSSVGDANFMVALMSYLHALVGAEHCGLLEMQGDNPVQLGAVSLDGTNLAAQQIEIYLKNYWRTDPTLSTLSARAHWDATSLIRLDLDSLPASGLRDIVYRRGNVGDRLLLSSQTKRHKISLSILRSRKAGKFSDGEMHRIQDVSAMLLPIVAKHADMVIKKNKFGYGLSSIDVITRCIEMSDEKFSRREAEVCAWMIFGESAREIGAALDIGEATVKTYRKRAYTRLGVTNQRELLLWYIGNWCNNFSRLH